MGTTTEIDREALRRKYREERDKRLRPDGNDQYIEGPVAYFQYIAGWRSSGDFEGLVFAP
jgi:hypothetical protein